MKLKKLMAILLILSAVVLDSCENRTNSGEIKITYPEIEHKIERDNYFGKIIEDKHRLLENVGNTKVVAWLEKEKNLTDSVLNQISFRDSLKTNLQEIMYSSNVRGGFPRVIGKKLFYAKLFFKERIEKICFRDSLNSPETELFDTKILNTSTIQYDIYYFEPSTDGRFVVLGLSPNGTESVIIKILDVTNRKLLPETIERANYGNPSWLPGQNAFLYTQLKEIKNKNDAQTMYENAKVKLHDIGTDPLTDSEVISDTQSKTLVPSPLDIPFITISPNSNIIVAAVLRGSTQYLSLFYSKVSNLKLNLQKKIVWNQICTSDEMVTSFAITNEKAYVLSFNANPNGALKVFDIQKKSFLKTSLLDGKNEVLEDMIQTNDHIYLKKLKNGFSSLISINISSEKLNEIRLPYSGYVTLKPPFPYPPSFINSTDLYFTMESWNRELSGYTYEPTNDQVKETGIRLPGKYGNPTDILVKEVEIKSHDGELVPLSIIYSKNTRLDGKNPTLLEAYGSYGVSMNSQFDLGTLVWLRMGGIYAVAHVRGGSEKGNSWYKAGFKANKSNTWKDFISCAKYLISNKYTSSDKLSAKGVSAGGIAAGMAIVERPELFKAALLQVAGLNSLRYENTKNSFSVSEFGTTKDSTEFEYLYAMDIYHHIKEGVQYPSVLITGEMNDDLVDIWQPAKAVAKFQEVSKSKSNVILFKVGTGGHSGELDKVRNELDTYSFLFWQLGDKRFYIK